MFSKIKLARELAEEFDIYQLYIEVNNAFFGDSIWTLKDNFDWLVTIDDDEEVVSSLQLRFLTTPHVKNLYGDRKYWVDQSLDLCSDRALIWINPNGDSNVGLVDSILRQSQNHVIVLDENNEELFSSLRDITGFYDNVVLREIDTNSIKIYPHIEESSVVGYVDRSRA